MMNSCKREGCNKAISDKATWCGDACRKASSRTQPGQMSDITPDKCTPDTQVGQVDVRVHADTYFRPRINPASLNWGEYMTAGELADNDLSANRVSIPGDSDYVGVYKKAS